MTKKKIAILGGGIAGLTAAYELSKTEGLRSQYDVTVYQMGWRLGGKLASGRQGPESRNVEHGLHVWFGFYDNAFNLLMDLYEHWDMDSRSPFQTWQDVVKPRNYTPIGYRTREGDWTYFPQLWAVTDDAPGGSQVNPDLWDIISGLLSAVEHWLFHPETRVPEGRHVFPVPAAIRSFLDDAMGLVLGTPAPDSAPGDGLLARLWRQEVVPLIRGMVNDAVKLEAAHFGALDWCMKRVAREIQENMNEAAGSGRIYWMFADYALAMLRGILNPAYGILIDGDLNRLNQLEYAEWMEENGCSREVLDSTFTRVLYEAIFQYTEGDRQRPDMEAGTALRLILRLIFTYKGSVLYEVEGGMGDLVIAPLYEVMRRRGVTFELFHKVTKLHLSDDHKSIAAVDIDVQAKATSGAYEPLFDVDYAPAWPDEPRWDQLEDGAALHAADVDFESKWEQHPAAEKKTLARGTDFDEVVLAIALGAFKTLNDEDETMVDELTAASPAFKNMCDHLGLVPSQAVQVWMDQTLAGLGFDFKRVGLSGQLPALVNGPPPIDIWADMSQVLAVEQWRGDPPKSVHYFCGVYDTRLYREPASRHDTRTRAEAEVKEKALQWFRDFTGYIWPGASVGDTWAMDWAQLHDDAGRTGEARFDAQFWRPNVDPTECCVQSKTDTCQYRLPPGGSTFDNLYLAGAWTRTGVNASCVEGAVMSGMGAARAISGSPAVIPGWDWLQKW